MKNQASEKIISDMYPKTFDHSMRVRIFFNLLEYKKKKEVEKVLEQELFYITEIFDIRKQTVFDGYIRKGTPQSLVGVIKKYFPNDFISLFYF